jgi:hypothetical protein
MFFKGVFQSTNGARKFSLAPGFSPVLGDAHWSSRFNGFRSLPCDGNGAKTVETVIILLVSPHPAEAGC